MSRYFEDIAYEKQDYVQKALPKGDYEGCCFKGCGFAASDLSSVNFIDCCFEDCDLSGVQIGQASFRDTVFKNCKLVGVHFEEANTFLFSPRFEKTTLTLSSFYGVKMKYVCFDECLLQEVDFVDADCSGVVFGNCDLSGARFENTNLEKADLSSAYNYRINPETNKLKKAVFSLPHIAGLLDKYGIIIR
ncbi:pentapeptide repeat-containing protein [Niabella sp. CC-SYL272]|uniref:pentapeptide repeat-containing protein n=1 Tax=Niabella agricola TaxID=2891571 RepID=UPI001F257CAE|nr:pentapeptide repeat-containing protein [Niabella agricola]MCF3109966.1 pentapeptide repeat-containing protein [Niabella agricola]